MATMVKPLLVVVFCVISIHAQDDVCSSTFPGCASCNNPPLQCAACANSTVRNRDRTACIQCPPGCATCTEGSDVCQVCESQHTMVADGKCLACPSNCRRCKELPQTGVSYCEWCEDGYYKKKYTSECTACPANCRMCEETDDGSVICMRCNKGLVYDHRTYQCLTCPEVCSSCHETLTDNRAYCTSCPDDMGLVLKNGRCKTCDQSNACLTCGAPCETCQPYCVRCKRGYFKPISGNCMRCQHGCDVCRFSGGLICDQCTEGFGDRGDEFPICEACPISNCLQCTYASCSRCIRGYVLYNNQCIKCPEDEHCRFCRVWYGRPVCGSCDIRYGYNYTTEKCESCQITACGICSHDVTNDIMECKECLGGYTVEIYNDTDTGIEMTRCVLTDPLYDSENCPDNCYLCYTDAETRQRKCHPDACRTGYGLSPEGTCTPCPTNCDYCLTENGKVVCRYCSNTFGLDLYGSCSRKCPKGCNQCQMGSDPSTMVCLSCLAGFELNDRNCAKCPSNCADCYNEESRMICSRCMDGYGASPSDPNVCRPCPSRCRTCSIAPDVKCQRCLAGFYMDDNSQCKTCEELTTPYCTECTRNNRTSFTCTACDAGYALKDDSSECVAASTISGCLSAVDEEISCSMCGPGFLLTTDGQCLPHCGRCGSIVDNDFRSAAECGINPEYIDYEPEACPSPGNCWVASREVDGEMQHARGCMRKPCPDEEANAQFCARIEGHTVCSKCCSGHMCDKNIEAPLKGKSSAVVWDSTLQLLVIAFCMAFESGSHLT